MPSPRAPEEFAVGGALGTEAFRGQARRLAPDRLGALLLVETPDGPVGGIVVETEAYVNGVDPASHLAAGRTPRTESFCGGPGTVYVYTIHGHHALDLISVHDGYREGILIRALEPTHGLDRMRDRRSFDTRGKLASGPGKLTEALGVTTAEFDGRPLGETRLSLHETDLEPAVAGSGRVGISAVEDWPLRFALADSPFLSRPVPTDEPLDAAAVERCYERLGEDCEDAYSLDPEG